VKEQRRLSILFFNSRCEWHLTASGSYYEPSPICHQSFVPNAPDLSKD